MSLLLAASLLLAPSARAAAPGKPRLAVVVVVDQMRADYLERDPAFTGGLKRLSAEGAVFTNATHLHVPTETGPGHAAISSGRTPATHGIVANEWWDRAKGAETYCVADEPYGIGPGHFTGPTLADALKAADPKARVFSVSGKDRAAVLLGGRKPDLALWLDRKAGVFTTSSYYRRPAWLDAFNTKLRESKLLPVGANGKLADETLARTAVDEATARLVEELMRREGAGRGPSTDLLLVSLSATDTIGHRYGTEAPQMVSHLRALDAILGRLLAAWEKAAGGRVLLALTADHGAIPAPEDPSGKGRVRRFDWDALEASMEAALQKRWPAPGKKWLVDNALPHLYLNRALAVERGEDWRDFRREAARVLARVDGLARVLVTAEIAELPPTERFAAALKRSVREDRAGDLMAIVAPDVLVHDQPTGTSHGTPWAYDARVPLVFWGAGAPRGRFDAAASPLDIAPTLGRALGLDYPAADGGTLRPELAPAAAAR